MRRAALIAIVGFVVSGASTAADVGGVKLDDQANVGGQPIVLNGAGVRSRAFFKIYVASLYVPAKATSFDTVVAKGPRRIQLNLLRNVTADQLTEALTDGLTQNNSPAELDAVKPQTGELVSIMRLLGNAKEGDVITLDFVAGSTVIALKGAQKGSIAGEPFNRALTKIWLGDKPAQTDLKQAMLGGG